MFRALTPYLAVSTVIAAVGGWAYSAGAIGVLAVYALIIGAGLVCLVGYVRWDERHHG